jgi:hypothetical protein
MVKNRTQRAATSGASFIRHEFVSVIIRASSPLTGHIRSWDMMQWRGGRIIISQKALMLLLPVLLPDAAPRLEAAPLGVPVPCSPMVQRAEADSQQPGKTTLREPEPLSGGRNAFVRGELSSAPKRFLCQPPKVDDSCASAFAYPLAAQRSPEHLNIRGRTGRACLSSRVWARSCGFRTGASGPAMPGL